MSWLFSGGVRSLSLARSRAAAILTAGRMGQARIGRGWVKAGVVWLPRGYGAIMAYAEHSTLALIAPHRSTWSRRALTPVAAASGHQTQGRAPLLGSLNPEGSGVMHQPQPIHQPPVTLLQFTRDVVPPFQIFHEEQKIPQGRRFC